MEQHKTLTESWEQRNREIIPDTLGRRIRNLKSWIIIKCQERNEYKQIRGNDKIYCDTKDFRILGKYECIIKSYKQKYKYKKYRFRKQNFQKYKKRFNRKNYKKRYFRRKKYKPYEKKELLPFRKEKMQMLDL